MNSIIRLVAMVAGFGLLMHVTPSWGQPTCSSPGCNPTVSDANGNTAGGTSALTSVDETATGGFNNTAFGLGALETLTTGDDNTAIGTEALLVNTGSRNTASGSQALTNNTTGNNNTASGVSALAGNSTGNFNTGSGFQALELNTAGSKNTAVGAKALKKSTGEKNIAIGFQAGVNLTSGNNNIYLDNPGVSAESLTMRLGNVQTSTFIAGIAGNNNVQNAAVVVIDTTTGQLGIQPLVVSSARYKRDIAPMGTSSEKVLALRPVTFAYRNDAQGTTQYGLIAEEVERVYPELVTHTATGEVQTVRYQELIPMLLNELQRQRQAFQQESAEVAMLRKELADLRALVGRGRETASLAR